MSGRIAYYGGIIKEGLVLNLDAAKQASYPKSGTDWYDLSGNTYNATLINGTLFTKDNGGALVFNGIDDYGRIPYNSNFDLSNTDYTLEGWFNSSEEGNPQIMSAPVSPVSLSALPTGLLSIPVVLDLAHIPIE